MQRSWRRRLLSRSVALVIDSRFGFLPKQSSISSCGNGAPLPHFFGKDKLIAIKSPSSILIAIHHAIECMAHLGKRPIGPRFSFSLRNEKSARLTVGYHTANRAVVPR